jgi:Lar family restriction alleviation protein
MAIENDELLPCPFCGSSAKLVHERTDELFSRREYLVQCCSQGTCYGRIPRTSESGFTYEEDAIRTWNKRDAPAPYEPQEAKV